MSVNARKEVQDDMGFPIEDIEKTVSGTTYVVSGRWNNKMTENAIEILLRLILSDPELNQ